MDVDPSVWSVLAQGGPAALVVGLLLVQAVRMGRSIDGRLSEVVAALARVQDRLDGLPRIATSADVCEARHASIEARLDAVEADRRPPLVRVEG